MDLLLLFVLALVLFQSALIAVLSYKVRRIHVKLFAVATDAAEAQRQAAALMGQLQSLYNLEKMLDMPRSLPRVHGWTATPDFLFEVAHNILATKPAIFLECGSGLTTVVAARCIELNGIGHVYSLEHDTAYALETRALLRERNLEAYVTIVHAPLTARIGGTPWYSTQNLELPSKIDLLVVDGPPTTVGRLARYPALPELEGMLATACTIFVDDAARPDEMEMLRRWSTEFTSFKQTTLDCAKGCVRLDRHAIL